MIVSVTMNPAVDETLTVPQFRLGETNRIQATDIDPGGKGLNVSRVIRRLGRPTVAVILIGGETGEFIRNRLEREGVDMELVEIEGTTRVNISIIDESTDVQTSLNHEGPRIDIGDLHAVERKIEEWLPELEVMVLGGSLPPGAPPDAYARLIKWVRQTEIRSILDTSGQALTEGIEAKPYMIKPNLRETRQVLGRDLKTDKDIVAAGQELVGRGIQVVVISMGKEGAIAVAEEGAWKARPPIVEKQSALGAGDSMVAGLAIGLSEHAGVAESLALGTAAATATVTTPGTELCRPDDVQELLPTVKVEKIA